jgi:alpha-D-ribose 1-methylphosphonate 5-triphosphate synthase subunit PhnL
MPRQGRTTVAKHLEAVDVTKMFTMHVLGGKRITAFAHVSFSVDRGRFLGISGKSGYGKSSLIKCIYRNYDVSHGDIFLYDAGGAVVNLTAISDAEMLEVRRKRMGYVSQFFRTIPRVTAMNVVTEPLMDRGWEKERAVARASELFRLFDIPRNLWDAYPSTFSGGEKQRVNIMRTLIDCPEILLLDEPTASLDRKNKDIILGILKEMKKQDITMIGIFHDPEELHALADEVLLLERPDAGTEEAEAGSLPEAGRADFIFHVVAE